MTGWIVERVVHFAPGDLVNDGFVHFGFHDRAGRQFLIAHQRHLMGLVGPDGRLAWTAGSRRSSDEVPNIKVALRLPMYVDTLADGSLVVSNFGNARLYRIDPRSMSARLLIDGRRMGMVDMGNCVVDGEGSIWINEVTGCRVWRFDEQGTVLEVLGDGRPGFSRESVSFEAVRFEWIYDLRPGRDGRLYVLDSRNFALRAIDPQARRVVTVAGCGRAGYDGDGHDAREATFGSDPSARFDGPISLSIDESGDAFIGDRFNHVVRMIEHGSGVITTIAGCPDTDDARANDPLEHDPSRVNLPRISSMDYDGGRLFVPTDLAAEHGDLVVLARLKT